MIIVCTIPGPKEPSCSDLNLYLACMVNDLNTLWEGVRMHNPNSVFTYVRVALLYISSDLPATHKLCGFYGLKAKYSCFKCLKSFPMNNLQVNYSGFERHEWRVRDIDSHREKVKHFKDATTKSTRKKWSRNLEFAILNC